MEEFIEFLENIANPPKEYRVQYFWFLNHKMNLNEMKRQMDLMKKNGAGGAFLHARSGRITPYMSKEWLNLCIEAIKYGKQIDFQVWIYDEDGFPSGYAGGQTIEYNKKDFSANFIVFEDEYEVEQGNNIKIDIKINNNYQELYGIVAIPVHEDELGYKLIDFPQAAIDITPMIKNHILNWTAPTTHELWIICIFLREWNDRATNVLSKKTIEKFISLTHQKYYDEIKENNLENEFGNRGIIPGIFTDEPGVMYCKGDKSWRRIIPYTPEMDMIFENKFELKFLLNLPAVFYEIEEIEIKYRLNFWYLAADMYSQGFFKTIHDWCAKNKIAFMGHVANEGNLYNQIRDQIDFFKCSRYMHFGCCDQLGKTYRAEFEKNYNLSLVDNMVAPRFAFSSKRINNLPRVNCECFGSSGWELSMENQKILIDWLIANGVDLFIPHDISYSIEGVRKRDHPPAFESCSYYDEINVLNDYIARLSYLFSRKESNILPRIGLLYGNTTILTDMNPMKGNASAYIHDANAYIIDILQRLHYDFDILPEYYIQSLKIENSQLMDTYNAYDIILLPSIETIELKTLEKLILFFKLGGKILFIQKIPYKFYPNSNGEDLISYLETQFQVNIGDITSSLEEQNFISNLKKMPINITKRGGMFGFLQAPRHPIWKNELMDDIFGFISYSKVQGINIEYFPKDEISNNLENSKKNMADFVVRRLNLKDEYNSALLFVANLSDKNYNDIFIRIRSKFHLKEIWNKFQIIEIKPLSGKIASIDNNDIIRSEKTINFKENFKPFESKIYFISEEGFTEKNTKNLLIQNSILDNISLFNQMNLNEWSITPKKLNIVNLNSWSVKYSVKKMGIERDSYLKHEIRHIIKFIAASIPDTFKVIIDGDITHNQPELNQKIKPNNFKLLLNGFEEKNYFHGEYLDFHMIESSNISNKLLIGENTLEFITFGILSSPMNSLTEPLRIYGDFQAKIKNKTINIYKWNLTDKKELLDLRKIGFPNYIGPIDYSTELLIDKDQLSAKEVILTLPKLNKPLYKIFLNQKEIGHVWFGEYKIALNISYLKIGRNLLIIRYFPFPTNLFETESKELGIIGKISLEFFK